MNPTATECVVACVAMLLFGLAVGFLWGCSFFQERVRRYLDSRIAYWRSRSAIEADSRRAIVYQDAYQAVRVEVVGESLLPAEGES